MSYAVKQCQQQQQQQRFDKFIKITFNVVQWEYNFEKHEYAVLLLTVKFIMSFTLIQISYVYEKIK